MKTETKRLIEDFMIALIVSALVMSWHKKKEQPEKPSVKIEQVRNTITQNADSIFQHTR